MGEFAGVFRRDGGQPDPAILDRLSRSLAGVGTPRTWRGGSFALAHRPLRQSEATRSPSQPGELRNRAVMAADVRLDEPTEIAAMLGLNAADPPNDTALVQAACERWGAGAAERLNGSFAFALWEEDRHRLILARDALGTRPLFYVELPRYVMFASSLQSLLALPETPRDIDDLVLAQTLTLESQDQERTLYCHIRRAPPGGMAMFDRSGSRTARYWTIENIAPVRLRSDDEYVEAARTLLDRAVQCRIPRRGRLGTTLSGGLDSSGIAATAARLLGDDRLMAFHRAPGAPHPYDTVDEAALVREVVARYPNIDLTIIDDAREAARDIEPEIDAAAMRIPRAASVNATWFESLAMAAHAAGTDVLLTGGCGNATLSWHGHPHFGEDLRAGRLGSVWHGVTESAQRSDRSIPGFLAGHVLKPMMPRSMVRWLQRRGPAGQAPWTAYSMVSPDFLTGIDYDRHARLTGHDVPFQPLIPRREQRLRALQSQTNRDKSGFVRRKWRHEAIDPYADRRMVEFTLGIPETQFWQAGEARWLARRVLADRLPASLLNQRRRGMQCPEWYAIVSRRREGMAAAINRIERSALASRVVDVARMKRLLDEWPKDAEAAKDDKLLYAIALDRGISVGGFLRWYEGGNE